MKHKSPIQMNLIQSTLVHKISPSKTESPAGAPALIMLHGRGADENDLLGLSEYLDERLFIISVRAPFSFSSGCGYTWFDIEDIGRPDRKMFAESHRKLLKFIEDAKNGYPLDSEKVFLLGFSMGSMMAYTLSLTHPGAVKGVIANSGLIPEAVELIFEWEKIKGKHFFVAHGIFDSIIPIAFARRARELLEKADAALTYREYEMDHQIDEESLKDIMNWLSDHI